MKHIYHLIIFVAGIGLGIWIGVKYPSQAQNVADQESQQAAKIQAAVSQEKINLLNRFLGQNAKPEDSKAEITQMLQDEKQKLQDAKSKIVGN